MFYRIKLIAFICTLFSFPAFSNAQTNSLFSNLANPSIGFTALFAAQMAADLPEPYGFQFQGSELSLVSAVDQHWSLTANLVFSSDEVVPEEVFVTTSSLPGIQGKIGRMKAAFGKHGLLHAHAFPFIQAPVIMGNAIGGEGFNDMGAEAAWLTPLPWFCEFTLGLYQSAGLDDEHPLNLGSSSHDNFPYLGHLKNQFDLDENTTLELGGSFLAGMGDDDLHHAVYGADLTLRNVPLRQSNERGWILQWEYLARDAWMSDGSFAGHDADGWYASFQYRWSQNWWSGLRFEEAFHSFIDNLTARDPGTGESVPAPGHVLRASANIAWVPSEFSFLRAEYSLGRADADDGSVMAWDHRLMLQLCTTIGFHPPHAY
jgi:hypothetical protein